MKDLRALVAEAAALSDEEYDNAQWVRWFNDALDDMTEALFVSKKATILSALDGGFPLPEDMKKILRLDGTTPNLQPVSITDDRTTGFKVIGGSAYIQGETPGSITLWYHKYPAYLTASDAAAPLDLSDHQAKAVVLYACAQAMLKEDESERYQLFANEYQMHKARVFAMSKIEMPSRVGVVEVVR